MASQEGLMCLGKRFFTFYQFKLLKYSGYHKLHMIIEPVQSRVFELRRIGYQKLLTYLHTKRSNTINLLIIGSTNTQDRNRDLSFRNTVGHLFIRQITN